MVLLIAISVIIYIIMGTGVARILVALEAHKVFGRISSYGTDGYVREESFAILTIFTWPFILLGMLGVGVFRILKTLAGLDK